MPPSRRWAGIALCAAAIVIVCASEGQGVVLLEDSEIVSSGTQDSINSQRMGRA